MVNIKSLVKNHRYVGFVCSSLEQFSLFIDLCKSQDIILSKSYDMDLNPHIESYEGMFEQYSNHLKGPRCIAMLVYKIHKRKGKGTFKEIQFYSRDYSEYLKRGTAGDIYNDWDKMTMIDFNQIMRDDKLKKLGINEYQ